MASMTSVNPAKSPPAALPLTFISAGVSALLLLQVLLVIKAPIIFGEFRFNPVTLTAVHLFTLGWATAIMMGAFYQLIPVILLTDAPHLHGALFQGATYLIGAAMLIGGFYAYATPLIITGGILVVTAVGLFAWLVSRMLRSSKMWSVTGTYLIAALAFLAGTVLWGLTLSFNLRFNFLGDTLAAEPLLAHLVLGIGGWFGLTIIGVAYQLIPMFTLSHRSSDRTALAVLGLIAGGLTLAFAGLLLHARLPAAVGLLGATAGVALFGWDLTLILRRRKRPRIDLGIRYALTAFGFLFLALVLALLGFGGVIPLLQRTPGPAAIIWFALFGFVATIILGMLYKIVPFLIWHARFRNRNGRSGPLPTLNEMYSPKLAEAGYRLWICGVLATGIVLLAGALGFVNAPAHLAGITTLLTAAGSGFFAWTLGEVIRA